MTYHPELEIGPKSPGVWREVRRLERERARLIKILQDREMHRPWCNGGYEGGTCSCDIEERMQAYEETGE